MRAKISIIVPVFNMEKYLHECMDSLINQTFKDIEIICFNDASTDNSLSILRKYESCDNRVKVIDSKLNIKQGGGRNVGIRMSSADYITFVDSDDKVSPKFAEILYKTAIGTNADIVVSDLYNWRPEEKASEKVILPSHNTPPQQLTNIQAINRGGYVIASLYRKSLFYDNDLFFPENMFYEDSAIAGPLYLVAKKIIWVRKHLYYYRKHSESTTNIKNDLRFFNQLDAADISVNHIKRLGKYNEFRECVNEVFFSQYLNCITRAFSYFKPIPYDKVKHIRKTIYERLKPEDINAYISRSTLRNRIAFNLLKISPRFSAASWFISGWIIRHLIRH